MAKFECVASGNPQPSVFWTKEGSQELMFPDNTYGHFRVSSEGTLEISNVRKDDAGYYVCSAFSVAGSGTTRAFLQVSYLCETFFCHTIPEQLQKTEIPCN